MLNNVGEIFTTAFTNSLIYLYIFRYFYPFFLNILYLYTFVKPIEGVQDTLLSIKYTQVSIFIVSKNLSVYTLRIRFLPLVCNLLNDKHVIDA